MDCDFSRLLITLSAPRHHHSSNDNDNLSTPKYKNNKIRPSLSPHIGFWQKIHSMEIEKEIYFRLSRETISNLRSWTLKCYH